LTRHHDIFWIEIEIRPGLKRQVWDVRMLIPPKLLANGLFRRGGAGVPDAATGPEALLVGAGTTEYQRRVHRESSCR